MRGRGEAYNCKLLHEMLCASVLGDQGNYRRWQREYKIERFYVDLAFPSLQIAVEVDGCYHINPKQQVKDRERQHLLESWGWAVLRVTEDEIPYDILPLWLKILEVYDSRIHRI